MTLRWGKPKEDSISYYIIQLKEYRTTCWEDALITNDQNCTTTQDKVEVQVPGLREGRWYQFRVIAVNKAGKSDPSPETEPHVCTSKGEFNTPVMRIWHEIQNLLANFSPKPSLNRFY